MTRRQNATKRLIKLGGHLARLVLLILVLSAAAAWWLWLPRNRALLTSLDSSVTSLYKNRYNYEIERIRALAAQSRHQEAGQAAWALVEEMGTVNKQDNDLGPYLAVLEILKDVSLKQNDAPGYLRVADKFTELDQNNYAFWLISADARVRNGDAEGGRKALRRAFALAPSRIEVAEPLALALYNSGDRGGAREVLAKHLWANIYKGVALYYASGGTDLKPAGSGIILTALNGTQHLGFDLGGALPESLVLVLPGVLGVSFRIESITLAGDNGPVGLGQFGLSLADIARTPEGAFFITGPAPKLFITLPEEARKSTGKVVIKIEFRRTLPQRLAHIMRGA